MEIQRVPVLDFEELGLVFGVVIPQKFKALVFTKYDGVSCPKLHLRSYVRKIQPHTADRNLWVHFFHDSLSGTQLEWFYQLEGTNVRNWEDLPLPVLSFRVCPWVQVKTLRTMRRSGEIWMGESNPLCIIGSWSICFWGCYQIHSLII